MAEVQKVFGDSPIYAVGGCVRDAFLKKTPKDYDFATPLTPEEIETAVKKGGRRAYMTGAKFGTIGFKVHLGGVWHYVEVTTFRTEKYKPGSRKPSVEFITDLREDQSRRDFTINAIAMGADGVVYDPFGGRLDIIERKIKPVGEATDRIKEDPLRMLRAARFASQIGFDLDPNFIGKTRKLAHTITTVSRERWVQEMDKLLCGARAEYGLAALHEMYLLRYMLPEVEMLMDKGYMMVETIKGMHATLMEPDHQWAALLMYIGTSFVPIKLETMKFPRHEIVGLELARGISARLRFSSKRSKFIEQAIEGQ